MEGESAAGVGMFHPLACLQESTAPGFLKITVQHKTICCYTSAFNLAHFFFAASIPGAFSTKGVLAFTPHRLSRRFSSNLKPAGSTLSACLSCWAAGPLAESFQSLHSGGAGAPHQSVCKAFGSLSHMCLRA